MCGGAGVAAVAGGEFTQRGRNGLGAALARLQAQALGRQSFLLAGLRVQAGEFVHRMAQKIFLAGGLGDFLLGGLQARGRVAP